MSSLCLCVACAPGEELLLVFDDVGICEKPCVTSCEGWSDDCETEADTVGVVGADS